MEVRITEFLDFCEYEVANDRPIVTGCGLMSERCQVDVS